MMIRYGIPAVLLFVAGLWFASVVLFQLTGLVWQDARPWSMWEYRFFSDERAYWIAAAAGCLPAILFLAIVFAPRPEKIHGNAKWASESDLRKSGLRAGSGIILGKVRGQYLMTENPSHHLLVGPTGSGKGVGWIIPNLLNWDGSAVVSDIKSENWSITAGFRRKHGHEVYFWSPMNPEGRTHRFNPLDMVRDDPIFRVTDLQLLASFLVPLPQKDPIWDQLARFLFVGLAMHVLDQAKHEKTPATIGEIYRLLNASGGLQWNAWEASNREWADPEGRRLLRSYVFMTEKERSFVKTSLAKALNLWSNPLVDAATSASDFDLRELRRKRMTIYLGTNPDAMSVLGPIIGLFFQQTISALTQAEPGPDEPHKVLMLMDEFPAMGKMELVADAVSTIRSYGGRMAFVVQGLSQLEDNKLYGREGAQTILQNCDYQTILGARDDRTTTYVVKSLGKKTVRSSSRTRTAGNSTSRSFSETGRDLMMFQEVQQMPKTDSIILVGSAPPVRAKKITYYNDKKFTSRLVSPPDVPKVIAARTVVTPMVVIDAVRPETPSEAATAFASGQEPPADMQPPKPEGGASPSVVAAPPRTDEAPAVSSTMASIASLLALTDPRVADEQRQLRELLARVQPSQAEAS